MTGEQRRQVIEEFLDDMEARGITLSYGSGEVVPFEESYVITGLDQDHLVARYVRDLPVRITSGGCALDHARER